MVEACPVSGEDATGSAEDGRRAHPRGTDEREGTLQCQTSPRRLETMSRSDRLPSGILLRGWSWPGGRKDDAEETLQERQSGRRREREEKFCGKFPAERHGLASVLSQRHGSLSTGQGRAEQGRAAPVNGGG